MSTDAPSDSIQSLPALKQRHSLMLRSNSEQAQPIPAEEILAFLQEAADVGSYLAADETREAAQGILDYWTSHLLSREPSRAAELGGYLLHDYAGTSPTSDDVSNAETLARELVELKQRAAVFEATLSIEERNALRHTLLNLFKLTPSSRIPIAAPLSESAPVAQQPDVQAGLAKLVEAGLVRRDGAGSAAAGYVLTRNELVQEWPLLREIARERQGFRDIASGWDKGGRQTAALLNRGSQLMQAPDYDDLSEFEKDFLAASKRLGARLLKLKRWAVYLGSFLAVLFFSWLIYNNYRMDKQIEALQAEKLSNHSSDSCLRSIADAIRADDELPEPKKQHLLRAWDAFSQRDASSGQSVADNSKPAIGYVEIFVSVKHAHHVDLASKFAEALKSKGFRVPAGGPLPRRRVADPTEIRYFHVEDKALAENTLKILREAGFKAPIAELQFLPDPSAPLHLIQISMARQAFD